MKSAAMKELADGLIGSIRRFVHENREAVESRIKATDTVVDDLRGEVAALSQRIDFLESAVQEAQRTLALKRVA